LSKIDNLRRAMLNEGTFNYFLIFNSSNLIYFSGFQGATALHISQTGENVLYVSQVNYEQAKAEVKNLSIQKIKRGENLMNNIASQISNSKSGKIAVDSVGIESWRALAKVLGSEQKIEIANNLIITLRKIKDAQEIELIREACKLTSIGMQVAYETIQPGIKEREVAAEIEYAMRKKGSDGTGFDTIVASGINSAFPHGGCSDRAIKEGEMVVVDIGATFRFYRSDMTRTFLAGRATEKQKTIYEIVKIAHQKACQAMKHDVLAKEVDGAARSFIEANGFGDFFVHNLGHGVGLDVHEPPILNPESKELLAAGNIVTNEPGIYLPGYGGVRIEDTFLISRDGAEKLTLGPYSLEGKN
jgi:Xaa-Pro dipeptidase